jgi:hypothetical protein
MSYAKENTPSLRLAANMGPGISAYLDLSPDAKNDLIATSIFWWNSLGAMISSASDYR